MKLRFRYACILVVILFLSHIRGYSQLYVGANYHPHDGKNPEKIKKDIQLMKAAGFKVLRLGHLAWDSYEPAEGKYDFAWFDTVMNTEEPYQETGHNVQKSEN